MVDNQTAEQLQPWQINELEETVTFNTFLTFKKLVLLLLGIFVHNLPFMDLTYNNNNDEKSY